MFLAHPAPFLQSRRSIARTCVDAKPFHGTLRCPQYGPSRHSPVAGAAVIEAVSTAVVEDTAAITDAKDSKQQPQRKPEREKGGKAIIVGDKPAANSLLRRLEQTPQTLIRATSNSEHHTYKTIATIAAAQGQLNQPDKVLLYVPFTKSSAFTAIVLPTSASVQQSSSTIPRLTVKNSTDPKDLANTLTFDLIKHGSAALLSAGAGATARATAALLLVRQQLLSRGYEVGVLPRFEEGPGKGAPITILSQQVVLQELPVPQVKLPRSNAKPIDTAAGAAQAMLVKQRRVQLLLPPGQTGRLSGLLEQVMRSLSKDEARERPAKGDKGQRKAREGRKRLLLVWPPSTADQLLESLEQLNHFATTPIPEAAEAAEAADAADAASSSSSGSAAAAAIALATTPMLQLQLRRSRLTAIPSPQDGPTGPGFREDRKPVVATSDSSVSGLAGALEGRVSRAGAAWLWSDGSRKGNATAWEALFTASNKMDTADGAGGLLALVDVQAMPAQQQRGKQGQQAASSQAQAEQVQQDGAAATAAAVADSSTVQQKQNQKQEEEEGKQQRGGVRLRMLVVRDSDIARSILQAPNSPIEVSVSADLWPLLKFTTAANTFLPVSAKFGTGGLLMLPAVLPAPEQPAAVAADYRFDDQKPQLVPYAIRLQRFTGQLPEGMAVDESQQLRVSLSTDPIKLRDAIVAKVLQQQPASVRFVGPLGRTPPLLTIAMAAVAAARVRLQQKGAAMDVGVMPYAETLLQSAADGGDQAAAEAAAQAGAGRGRGGKGGIRGRGQQGGSSQGGRVVYSLRLVPMPAVPMPAVAAAAAPAADASSDHSS